MYNKVHHFFPNISVFEKKCVIENMNKIINHLSSSLYVDRHKLMHFLFKSDQSFIGIINLILPFYPKTYNNLFTLLDLFYNPVYTNKYIETSIHTKKPIESILDSNTQCILRTIDVVSNKLYFNGLEVVPITICSYTQEKIYNDTKIKISEQKRFTIPIGLKEGDIYNVLVNDLFLNCRRIEWLIKEHNGHIVANILRNKSISELVMIEYDDLIKEGVKYMVDFFPEYNSYIKGIDKTNHRIVFLEENQETFEHYIKQAIQIFDKSWFGFNSNNKQIIDIKNIQIYNFSKKFFSKKTPFNSLWMDLSHQEKTNYDRTFQEIINSNKNICDVITDVIFQSLIIKGCLSKLNLDFPKGSSQNPESFFFLNSYQNALPPNSFYTMNWISQLNFFNHFINHRVIFVTGGTGVGKSTQSPVLILYSDIMIYYCNNSRVVCSVPRQNAVENNCKYIRKGLSLIDGEDFSIQFRHKDKNYISPYPNYKQNLLILTDEILKNSITKNIYGVFKNNFVFNHILIDESHEHKINMDLILTILKHSMLKFNLHTKLFIISATMDEDDESYRKFFLDIYDNYIFYNPQNSNTHFLDRRLHISAYNVQNNFTIKETFIGETKNYNESEKMAIDKAVEVINSTNSGTVLIFSIGKMEIEKLVTYLNTILPKQVIVFPLASKYPNSFKNSVSSTILDNWLYDRKYVLDVLNTYPNEWNSLNLPFEKNKYKRYVIIGTNIVEASLTINTLKYVFDTGYEKVSIYNKSTSTNQLIKTEISESSRIQRRGRVGRVSDGFVFYAYSKDSKKNNKIQKEIENNDVSEYMFNLLGYNKIDDLNNILQYLKNKDSYPYYERYIKSIEDNQTLLFFDGFPIRKIREANFFIIKPSIHIGKFFDFHLKHPYWKFFLNKDFYEKIVKLKNVFTYKYINIYETLVLFIVYKNASKSTFIDTIKYIFENKTFIYTFENINIENKKKKIVFTFNYEVNLFMYYMNTFTHNIYTNINSSYDKILNDKYFEPV